MAIYLNSAEIVRLIPVVEDIRDLIKRYLIPSPPIYGDGVIKGNTYYFNTTTGGRCISMFSDDKSYHKCWSKTSNYSSISPRTYKYKHSCGHYIYPIPVDSLTYTNTLCYWCQLENLASQ